MEGNVAVGVEGQVGHARLSGPAPSNFAKLRSGPGLRPTDVAANQRLRLRTAMALLVFEHGYESVTVRGLSRLAGVSTATFYGHFANTEACLAFACEETMRQMVDRADRARQECGEWRDGLRILVRSISEQMSERPQDAYLITVGIHTGGPLTTCAAQASSRVLEHVLVDAFKDAPCTVVAPRRLIAGMAAALARVARTTTIAGKAVELPGLSGQIAEWMLTLSRPEVMRLRAEPGIGSGILRRLEELPIPNLAATESSSTGTSERARILAASRKLAITQPSEITVSTIRREAGVSRRAFDAIFADATEAVLSSIEDAVVDAAERADGWAAFSSGWDRRTYMSVVALCAQAARGSSMSSLVLSDLTSMGGAGLLCRERLITRAATAMRRSAPPTKHPSDLVAEASVSAAWQIARDELSRTGAHDLPQVVPFLAYVLLAPAVGPRRAVALASCASES
jgi:AcrR family transcriptional regulator